MKLFVFALSLLVCGQSFAAAPITCPKTKDLVYVQKISDMNVKVIRNRDGATVTFTRSQISVGSGSSLRNGGKYFACAETAFSFGVYLTNVTEVGDTE